MRRCTLSRFLAGVAFFHSLAAQAFGPQDPPVIFGIHESNESDNRLSITVNAP